MTLAIPKYTFVEKLGEGGMATVWLARRDHDARLSVIKVLHDHLANDPVVQSRFLREAQVAAFLDHPNVARLYDAGRVGSTLYIAMELIPGQDVEGLMNAAVAKGQILPPKLTTAIGLRALEGLAHAHEHRGPDGVHLGIVHRDLSPRNLMVTFDGGVKIIDFGLVRTSLGDFRTAPGMIAGTLRYMSPEQATADHIDHRSDLYTLGVVLYELYSGRPVVIGIEAKNILGAVVVDSPPPLSQRNPNLPKGLDHVLAKSIEKDREMRFANALDFRDALALAAGELGVVSDQELAEMVGALAPEAKAKARERIAAVPERPQAEETRVVDASENIATRADLYRPPPAPALARPRPSSKRTVVVAAAAAAAAAMMVAVAIVMTREPEPLPPPIPPQIDGPQPTVSVSSIFVIEESQKEPGRKIQRPVGARDRSVPPPPPELSRPPPEPRVTVTYEALEAAAHAKLKTPDAVGTFFQTCGLVAVLHNKNLPEFDRAVAECSKQLDEQP